MTGNTRTIDAESARALVDLVDEYRRNDASERERCVDEWVRAAAYWEGDQNLYEDLETGTMRPMRDSPDWDESWEDIPDRVMNIYRVHGESVIAATVSDMPSVTFWPDDADSEDDKSTAAAWTVASELIQRQNRQALLDRRTAMFIWLYGHAFSYTWTETSAREFERGWPVTGQPGPDGLQEREWADIPKTLQNVEIISPREVHADSRADRLEHSPFLIRYARKHRNWLIERHPEYASMFDQETEDDGYEDTARAHEHGHREPQAGIGEGWIEVKYVWLQSWAIREPSGADGNRSGLLDRAREEFPDGVHMLIVGEDLVYARNERMLDHWTKFMRSVEEGANPPAQGKQTIETTDLENEAANAMIDALKHSVPALFSVTSIIDPEEFTKAPALAGQWHGTAEPPNNKSLGESFWQPQGTRLPDGIDHVLAYLKATGEKVSGDLPSIMGAPNRGGSKTLGEWMDSKAQATKRLDITYFDLGDFKAETMGKAVKLYFDEIQRPRDGMLYDRKSVKKQGSEYVNVWIRHAQLQGRVGDITPEAVRGVPLSIHEQRRVLLELIQQPTPVTEAILADPGNLGEAVRLLGLRTMSIPHADSTDKQRNEIKELLKSGPQMTVDPDSQEQVPMVGKPGSAWEGRPMSTIDPHDTDYHEIEAECIRTWASSLAGRQAFEENPQGFANVLAHYAQHAAIISMHNMQAQESGIPPSESERLSAQGGQVSGSA